MKGKINIAISTESKQVIFSDEILLKSVLKPYKRNCHYLINAFVKYHPSVHIHTNAVIKTYVNYADDRKAH